VATSRIGDCLKWWIAAWRTS